MNKVIGMSISRSGSTYLFHGIGSLNRILDSRHRYLGEMFYPIAPNVIQYTKNNDISIRKSISFKTPILNPIPKNHEIIKILNKCKHGYTCKINPIGLCRTNVNLISSMFNDKSITKLFLYRKFLVDNVISWLFYQVTNKLYVLDLNNYEIGVVNYTSEAYYNLIKEFLIGFIGLLPIYHSYKWDYVIEYDDLSGDPSKDFLIWFKKDEIKKLNNYYRKLSSREEKMKNFNNYETFLYDFKQICKELNLPEKLPISRSDLR